MTTPTPDSRYIHGTEPHEQHRLGILNRILNEGSLREIGLLGRDRVLDIGCGPGHFTRAMARIAASVIGIERDQRQIDLAHTLAAADHESALVQFRQGDVYALPLRPNEWGHFDVVHARFLLEHLPDPLAAVKEMVRAVKPGGRIVLSDDDHDVMRLHPEPAGFAPLWTAYMRCYDRLGNDPWVGRRLVQLLHQAGAQPMRNTWIWFGCCAGDERFPLFTENLIGVIETARQPIERFALLEPAAFDAAIANLRDWARRPDAAIWYPMCWAEGVV